ncbi:hypothetical protein PHMEG_00022764 [Phytophthora megakarya]|uniref:Uncharacterized protein n=1 Tax=Phytophthora megakarya TaxID=4795 RepID=A0A225VHX7_9STRA|nr:hypothetical protein PHMEG_00022764 [Phytophthora megakarya]
MKYEGYGVLLAQNAFSQGQRRAKAVLKRLRCRLHDEILRLEWNRFNRIRQSRVLQLTKYVEEGHRPELPQHYKLISFDYSVDLRASTQYLRIALRMDALKNAVATSGTRIAPRFLRGFDASKLMFGARPSTLTRVLNDAEIAVRQALRGFFPARIVCHLLSPTSPSTPNSSAAPLHQFIWGFVDGKNYSIQQPVYVDIRAFSWLLRF